MADDPVRTATEDWFVDRGLPHFIADYDAATDIWTRALPALTLLVLVEVAVLAPKKDFPIWLDVVVIAGAFALLLGAWALVNRQRGRRPLQRPDDLGPVELAAFVLGPALIAAAAGGQIRQGLFVAAGNVVLLGVVYVATSYGVLAILRWAFGMFGRQLGSIVSLLARALPMIALLVTFLFLTAEVWETAGALDGAPYWIVVALFPIVAILFVVARVPRDVGSLNEFEEPGDFDELIEDTPIAAVASARGADEHPDVLGRREWGNVGLVALSSQGVQIVLVSLVIGGFFVMLGLLLVDEETTLRWSGHVQVLATLSLGDRDLVLTTELLRVAGFLTAFTCLNFTVYLVTDASYREEFRSEVVGELRQAFAVRAAYRTYLASRAAGSSTMSPT